MDQLGLSSCRTAISGPACPANLQQFEQAFATWTKLVPLLLLLVPVAAGAFTGAAVVAMDIERGTFRYAWTQGSGRLRLLTAKLAVLATALLLASASLSALASWWFSPLSRLGYGRMYPQYFPIQGPAFVAWTLLAFAIAVLAGSVLRRAVVTIATTMAAYAGLATLTGLVLRYRFYRPPAHATASLGLTSLPLPGVPTGAWWAGPGGRVIPRAEVSRAIFSSKSTLAVAHWIITHDAHLVLSYQPAARFWPFQWTETAWLVAVTGLLLGAAFAVGRRMRPRAAIAIGPVLAAVALPAGTFGIIAANAAAATTTAGSGVSASSAGPSPVQPQYPGRLGYLALGDSVAFGFRPVTSAATYLNPANFIGYPEDVAKALQLNLANASCPGETTSSMINTSAPSNGCETNAGGSPGYRRLVPLHVSYSGSQLSFAVRYLRQHPDTRLVTIDIGANDMFLCEDKDQCTGRNFNRALANVTANLDTILGTLRHQAHYRRPLVVLTYYALNYGSRSTVTQTRELNAALAGSAGRYGAHVADGFAAFRAASSQSHGNACAAGLLIKPKSGGCNEHPSALGQRVLAAAIEKASRRDG